MKKKDPPSRIRIVCVVDNKSKPPLLSSHGVSFFFEATYAGDRTLAVFMDAGSDERITDINLSILEASGRISRSNVVAVVLSHGHWDHGDGLPALAKFIGRIVPLVAHPFAFKKRVALQPYIRRVGLKYSESGLERMGFYVVKVQHMLQLMPSVFFSGEIPREYPPAFESIYFIEKADSLIEDDLIDDASIFAVTEEAVVVLSGCGHSGILNIVKRVREAFNRERKYKRIVLVGGFHLEKKGESELEEISNRLIQLLSPFEEAYVCPCHCSGEKFVRVLKEVVEESGVNVKVFRPVAGSEIIVEDGKGIQIIS